MTKMLVQVLFQWGDLKTLKGIVDVVIVVVDVVDVVVVVVVVDVVDVVVVVLHFCLLLALLNFYSEMKNQEEVG